MTSAGPWSVKGIDPKAREIAKDLARRSGMTLGEWLNQMIIDGGDTDMPSAYTPAAPEPHPQPRRPLDELYREAQAPRRPAAASRYGEETGLGHLLRSIESLSTRLETAEQRSALAISGIDQSVMGVLTRLDDIERDQEVGVSRSIGSAEQVRAAQADIADRLRRLEGQDGARTDTLKTLQAALDRLAARIEEGSAQSDAAGSRSQAAVEAVLTRLDKIEAAVGAAPEAYADAEKVETVLTRMADRLDEAETKTTVAVQSLQASFAGLDVRLRNTEARNGPGGAETERRFQTLAADLSQKVEAVRADLSQTLREAADGRMDKLESALRELGGHVDQAETRSAQAIDRIGREVLQVARTLGRRVEATERAGADAAGKAGERLEAVEARSTAAVEAVGGEVSRLADAMESRLRHADGAQAEAMEKLGGEIARIAERLAERISTSDRRSADAIDEMADKLAKIGAGIEERHTRSASDLAERIRQSEARTADLLAEARERLDQRPVAAAAAPAALAPEPPPPPAAVEPAPALPEPAPTPVVRSNADPFDSPDPALATASQAEADQDPFARRDPFAPSAGSPFDADDDFGPSQAFGASAEPSLPEAPAPTAKGFGGAAFAPAEFEEPEAAAATDPAEGSPFLGFSVSDFMPAEEAAPSTEQLSTREMLDAARQAARRAASGRGGLDLDIPPGSVPAPPPPKPAAQAPRPFGLTFPGRRKKETAPTLRTMVLASATAGAITTMGIGAYLLGGSAHGGGAAVPPRQVADATPLIPPASAPQAPALQGSATPNLAVALAPTVAEAPFSALKAGAKAAPGPAKTPAARTQAASEVASPAAVPAKTVAASPHALYLSAVGRIDGGDLTGMADLKKAAEAGEPAAQFYLARLYESGGAGVQKNLAEARRWTGRAAEGGDASAMYNFASYLYDGDGGAKDAAAAAGWFRRSAERGVVNAQYNLAQLYEKGYAVPQSATDAYKWYLVAAASGDSEAKAAADALKPKLAAAAQASAERGAAELRAGLDTGVKTAAATRP